MRSYVVVPANENSTEGPRGDHGVRRLRTGLPRIVTTSWDDGDALDLRVARMLADRKLPATFYIPVKGHHGSERMSRADMLALGSCGFEIGAHGISHPNLPECEPLQLAVEVEGSKKRLEDDLGKQVKVFAYPRGKHNRSVMAAVGRAGFIGARTTAMLARGLTFDPLRMPTSVQAFPHSRAGYARNLASARNIARAWKYRTLLWHTVDWVDLARHLFDTVLECGGVWHLYGHSWEIDKLNLWEELGVVLDFVSKRPGVSYLANGEVAELRAAGSATMVLCGDQSAT